MAAFLIRNGALVGGIVLTAIVFLLARPMLMDGRGQYMAAVLQSDNPTLSVGIILLCVAAATLIAIGVTRLTNACVGFFAFGLGMYALDFRLSTIRETLLAGSIKMLPVELALWTALILGVVWAVFRFGGKLRDVHPDEYGRVPSPWLSAEAMKSAAAALVVLPVVWFLAANQYKGQTVGAVFVATVLAGLIGRLLSPHVQPILLFAAPLLVGVIGYIIGIATAGAAQEVMFRENHISPMLLPMPIDYVCGTLAGVAIGFGWARSFLHHEDEDEHVAAPSALR